MSCRGEADLHQHLASCEKNPGHKNFIPVHSFTLHHLPAIYRDEYLHNMILALSDITVRVDVRYTSLDRPDTYPNSDRPYPFAGYRGSDMMRTGTGWLIRVNTYPVWENTGTCPCPLCKLSDTPQPKWAEICIRTAAHVVFDDAEGAHTTCHFFYDSSDTDLHQVLAFQETICVQSNIEGDWCDLTYVTHDLKLAKKLADLLNIYLRKHFTIAALFPRNYILPGYKNDTEHNLAVIISHPHGCSKQISFGRVKERKLVSYDLDLSQYTYTTATCPGSSGAPVYILGSIWYGCDHPHSGTIDDVVNVNYSGIGYTQQVKSIKYSGLRYK